MRSLSSPGPFGSLSFDELLSQQCVVARLGSPRGRRRSVSARMGRAIAGSMRTLRSDQHSWVVNVDGVFAHFADRDDACAMAVDTTPFSLSLPNRIGWPGIEVDAVRVALFTPRQLDERLVVEHVAVLIDLDQCRPSCS